MTKQTKYQVIILTNGTIVQKFQLPKGMSASQVSFQISLDGPNSAAHDRVRGKGSFEKTRRGVARLINAGFTVELQSVLSLQSMPFIYELFNTAKEWGVSSLKFTRLISNGQGKALVSDGIDLPLTANELKIAYENIIQSAALTNVSTSTDVPLMHLLHPSLGGHGRFFESVVIDYTGKYLASSRSRIVLGDALSDGIESIFLKHPLLRDLRKGKVKVCRDCRFNRQCGGDRNAAFAASGDYLGADPGCWLYSTKQQICN
jgi:MoaA/NifB/PqqE/SkfB family radical SAM enzyme